MCRAADDPDASTPMADDSMSPPASKRLKRSYVACRPCHSRKVKCSGGEPCRNCKQSNRAEECVYPVRDRKIIVSERYLKQIEAENKSLREEQRIDGRISIPSERTISTPGSATEEPEVVDNTVERNVHNPLVPERARLLHNLDDARPPVYMGDSACSAFGARVRQVLDGDQSVLPNKPGMYYRHRVLQRICKTEYSLPNRNYANLLVRVVLRFIGSDYHLMLKKTFMEQLDETYKGTLRDPVFLCRMFIIFALGEMYSCRPTRPSRNGPEVPGTGFFLQAMSIFQDLHEEATVSYIETVVLVAYYSLALNRQNTAFSYMGVALRLSLSLGLHRNVGEDRMIGPVEREHRLRVWWTVYNFDRMCSLKMGHPITIRDEDIDAEIPSMDFLTEAEQEEFADPTHLAAKVTLSRITGNILTDIYRIRRPGQQHNFIQSVHKILTSLRSWSDSLSPNWRVDQNGQPIFNGYRPAASLHLHFNHVSNHSSSHLITHKYMTTDHG
ncbi:hypothetical protein L228DRAFT_35446 [Xylona heveae TC161]|uniref:Zn(2)-C6 fungal-type domain-containing protein n=1 Tax=Xylona heveae (strain CBS 132557 / TC161) TaxID=1328760 RepID=A0A165A8F1_XYLHT|nr:hypothetical protein L228DRAFT_35446 [Xylona heveae TC161]KZF20094.1 hypothetical protein L228DRAFT_35446 [Xylona heveae TC161]